MPLKTATSSDFPDQEPRLQLRLTKVNSSSESTTSDVEETQSIDVNETRTSDIPTTCSMQINQTLSLRDTHQEKQLLNSFSHKTSNQSEQSNLFRDIQNSPEKGRQVNKTSEEAVKPKRVSIGGGVVKESTSPTKKQDQENKVPSSGKENTS